MNHDPDMLLLVLVRTTLALAAAGVVTAATLRLSRANWPAVHRLGWVLTLLVGWTFLRLPLTLPWYDAPPAVTVAIAQPTPIDALPQGFDDLPPLASPAESPPESSAEFVLPAELPSSVIESTPAVETAVIISPHRPRFIGSGVALVVWSLGVALLPVAWLVGYLRFVRSLGARSAGDEAWQGEWRELQAADRIVRPIPLSVTSGLGPLLCRLPRGYELLVPEPLWRELDADQRRAILRHELAHYRRGDVWKSLGARVLALPHWFNPIAWWAVRRFDDAAEWACDRAAIAGEPATAYASALVRLGELPGSLGYGSAAWGRTLAARVRRVLAAQAPEDSMFKKTGLIAVGLLLAATSGVQVNLVAKQPAANESSADAAIEVAVGVGDEPQSPGRARGSSADTTQAAVVDGSDSGNGDSTPAARMVAQAQRAYEAHQAAFEAETVTMPSVYEWSRRWMEAARGAARDKAGRVAALRGHLERMQGLHKKIARLNEVGTKGGEAKDLAAASFYVAEAEQWLAATEAASGQPPSASPIPPEPQPQVIDLKIKIAELEGQIEQTKIALETAKVARDSAHAVVAIESGAISRSEQARIESDYNSLVARLHATKEQLNLVRQKLKLATPTPQVDLRQPEDVRSTERDPRTAQAGILDLTTRIAELNGQLERAKLAAEAARIALESVRADLSNKTGTATRAEASRVATEFAKSQSECDSIKEQLKLYNEKLKLAMASSDTRADNKPPDEPESQRAKLKQMVDRLHREVELMESTLAANKAALAGKGLSSEQRRRLEAESSTLEPQLQILRRHFDDYNKDLKPTTPAAEAVSQIAAAPNLASSRPTVIQKIDRLESEVLMHVDANRLLSLDSPIAKLQVADPDLLDATSFTERTVKIHAKRYGVTTVNLWNDENQAYVVRVFISAPRYEGKTFSQWANELETDLSPGRQTEAIRALAAFGAQGEGQRAAAAILEAIKGYSTWMIDSSPAGNLKTAASDAFTTSIPKQESWPLVVEALKSDNANQRLFAARVLPDLTPNKKGAARLLAPMVTDPSAEVRRTVASWLLMLAPETPGLLDIFREALHSKEYNTVQWAVSTINQKTAPVLAALAPDLTALLDQDSLMYVGMGGGVEAFPSPQSALANLGSAALPALEEAAKSNDPKTRERAENLLKQIRKKMDEKTKQPLAAPKAAEPK